MVTAMETAILTECKQQITAIGADARQCDALIGRGGIVDEFLVTKAMRSQIKRTAIEVVLYFCVGSTDVLTLHLLGQGNGFAVIKVFAVWRPGGVDLQQRGIVRDDTHRVGLYIVENHVAGFIINLNLIRI